MTEQNAEQTTEGRISALEREVVALKQQLTQMMAERRPLDDLRAEIARVSRDVATFSAREQAHEDYMRARLGVIEFDLGSINRDIAALQTGQQELQTGQQGLREELQSFQKETRASLQDLRIGQQEIATGQRQILEFLLGKQKQND